MGTSSPLMPPWPLNVPPRQDMFRKYHQQLFVHQDSLGIFSYTELANKTGVPDIAAFENCVQNQQPAQIITDGTNLARELGITGIPTFMINGKLVSGVLSEQQFEFIIKEALAETGR
ncbi:MAG: DsbA family protein [Balneolaceae bacterium]|nr:DsbA family protein [Balneolaceae bacterium]